METKNNYLIFETREFELTRQMCSLTHNYICGKINYDNTNTIKRYFIKKDGSIIFGIIVYPIIPSLIKKLIKLDINFMFYDGSETNILIKPHYLNFHPIELSNEFSIKKNYNSYIGHITIDTVEKTCLCTNNEFLKFRSEIDNNKINLLDWKEVKYLYM